MRCGVCEGEGHSARSQVCSARNGGTQLLPPREQERREAVRALTREQEEGTAPRIRRRPTCGTCGQLGHTSRSSICTRVAPEPVSAVRGDYRVHLSRQESVVNGRHSLNEMIARCRYCRAVMWPEERNTRGMSSFLICCHHGQVVLPPVPPIPELLRQLISRTHPDSSLFIKHVRAFNSNLAFTSAGVCEEAITSSPGTSCYVISGELHHLMGSLLPSDNNQGRFAQLYLYDAQEASVARSAYLMRVVRDRSLRLTHLLDQLTEMIAVCNPYAQVFKSAAARLGENHGQEFHVRLVDARGTQTPGTHNLPTADEIAIILPGTGDEQTVGDRDIVIEYQASGLRRVPFIHPAYYALQFPLLFPLGEDGWRIGIPLQQRNNPDEDRGTADGPGEDNASINSRKTVSLLQYTSYRLMIRPDTYIFKFGRLFLQFVVDAYARIEAMRLMFLRTHQDELRVESYRGLCDALDSDGVVSYQSVGRRIILPSSFPGSPRHMHQQYQDAMAIVRKYFKPDLFITMTCNPKWPEIVQQLAPGEQAADRPDLCVRVFNLKLKALLDDLLVNNVMGRVVAHVYVVEFQKRGLPHAHILLILHSEDKPRNSDDYDRFVSAEIPDVEVAPLLHATVTTSMLHGPCGAKCLDEHGKCKKSYPKSFQAVTEDSEDGYPLYRRRNDGMVFVRNETTFTNRDVVPYNPFLAQKYNCHINVEICSSVKSVKYLFKYVHKGHNRVNSTLVEGGPTQVDEITRFTTGRYVSQCEAVHRIFQFKLHDRSPAVVRLAVHEENMHSITLPGSAVVTTAPDRRTTLTAFFALNTQDEFARTLLYHDIPTHYSWDGQRGRWNRRVRNQRAPTIGRMYFVSPTDNERFFLRLLLTQVTGVTSFHALRTVDGVAHATYGEACVARGLLQDDTEWRNCLREAFTFQTSGVQLRSLFTTILLFGNVTSPRSLWTEFRDDLISDIMHRLDLLGQPTATAESEALHQIQAELRAAGKSLQNFPGMPVPTAPAAAVPLGTLTPYVSPQTVQATYNLLNADQRRVYDQVCHAIQDESSVPKLYYLDGPGGTGKTFLYNAIIDDALSRGKHVVVVSSSGISAILLKGGRTAHSAFKIPISNLAHDSVCSLSVNSQFASVIRTSAVTIWDEVGMMHRFCIEAVDRLYRDIMRISDPTLGDVPFGAKPVIVGGDFKQVLPVIPGASRATIVSATLPRSHLWRHFNVLRLTINMRVERQRSTGADSTSAATFANMLLNIGNGSESHGDEVELPPGICIAPTTSHQDNIQRIIDATYPDFALNANNPEFLLKRAILAPKNDIVTEINTRMLDMLPGNPTVLRSVDTMCASDGHASMYPAEFLNSLSPSGMPPHALRIKPGMPVLLTRNLKPTAGLCNGARLIVRDVGVRVLQCEIAVGAHAGTIVALPRIITSPTDDRYPFEFQRLQFPVQPAFALTINKSQGQTLSYVGIYLKPPVFTHGQLYVAMSRVGSSDSIKILATRQQERRFVTKNIVFREALI